MSSIFSKVAIIGLSNVGYTLCESLKKINIVQELAGFDVNYENIINATKYGLIDNAYTTLSGTLLNADFIILNMNHSWIIENIREINSIIKDDCVVTDLSPIKEKIINEVLKYDTLKSVYISSIPLVLNRSNFLSDLAKELAQNSVILSALPNTRENVVKKVKFFWNILKVKVVEMDYRRADKTITAIKHLPSILLLALFETIVEFSNYQQNVFELWGNNFKLIREIILDDPSICDDILLHNKANVMEFISRIKDTISIMESKIKKDDPSYLKKIVNQIDKY